jgi:hypothetical protein
MSLSRKLKIKDIFLEREYDTSCEYTLKDEDFTYQGKVFPSLYKLYIDFEDITEYDFALKYIGTYKTWETLCNSVFFKEYIAQWRKELELKLRARALNNIRYMASDDVDKNRFTANKLLLDKGWVVKENNQSKRGRPSKEEILSHADMLAQTEQKIKEDFERINKNTNNSLKDAN